MSAPQPRGDAESAAGGRVAGGGPSLVALPRSLTPFFGRDALVRQVLDALGEPGLRLLTLTGPGGVGKTRLALRAAELAGPSFEDGVVFVPLDPIVDPALVLPAVGRALGLTGGERPVAERLAEALASRRVLLVLDNMEQVWPAAPQVADLLRATQRVVVLATSRAPLRVEGEHELPVPPLGVPPVGARPTVAADAEAVRFFLERAHAVRPDLTLTPPARAAVAEIARRLDGLPLALDLAAARTKVLSPEALLTRLERQLHVLTGGPQDRPARQQTMRAAVAWSYDLLHPDDRALFRRLSVFRGGLTLEDAEAVLGSLRLDGPDAPEMDLLDRVSGLLDHSLLQTEEREDGEVRFRMLEPVREFALEQLTASGEAEAVWSSFAAHWTALAENTWAHTAELDDLNRAVIPLERSHDNVRAALDWLEGHDPARAVTLAGGLSWFWYLRGHHAEALRRARRLLALPDGVATPAARARLLGTAGWNAHFQGETGAAVGYLEAALALWRSVGDEWGTGYTLLGLGTLAEDTGAFARAETLLAEAVERLSAAGDAGSAASARYHLAVVAFARGDLAGADALLDAVLSGSLGEGVRIAGWAMHLRGLVALARGDQAGALRSQLDALRRFRETRYLSGIAEALAGLAVAAVATDQSAAVRIWAVAERMAAERGDAFQPPERTVYDRAVAGLRARLGEAAFDAEHAAGLALSEDEAVETALALALPVAGRAPTPAADAGASHPTLAKLTSRERQVLALLVRGWTNDRIGEELFLSPRTVQTHLTNVFRKMEVENRVEAVRVAVDAGLA